MPTASANRGSRCLNRCISPLDCLLDDVMHFFYLKKKVVQGLITAYLVHLLSATAMYLKGNLTSTLVDVW